MDPRNRGLLRKFRGPRGFYHNVRNNHFNGDPTNEYGSNSHFKPIMSIQYEDCANNYTWPSYNRSFMKRTYYRTNRGKSIFPPQNHVPVSSNRSEQYTVKNAFTQPKKKPAVAPDTSLVKNVVNGPSSTSYKQFNKFEVTKEKVNKFEGNYEKCNKFEGNYEKCNKFEGNKEKVNKFEGNYEKCNKFEGNKEKVDKFEGNYEKCIKFEEKLNKFEGNNQKFTKFERNYEKFYKYDGKKPKKNVYRSQNKLGSTDKEANKKQTWNNTQLKGDRKKLQSAKVRVKNNKRQDSIIVEFDTSKSFDEQSDDVINQISCSKERLELVEMLRQDVQKAFKMGLGDIEAVVFGSNLSGIAFKNSDVDIFLKSSKSLTVEDITPAVHHMLESRLFRRLINIFHARVPIVRALNNQTNLSVDVSFTSSYGVTTSNLVKHLCSVDPRVRRLIMIVLFWAKKHNLVSTRYMSSSTVNTLVIFYLQIVGILPPLNQILKSDGLNLWPVLICEDKDLLKNSNKDDLSTLIVGFFSFYSSVHFEQVVISPFYGELVLSSSFSFQEPDPPCEPETIKSEPDLSGMDRLPKCFHQYRELVKSGAEKPFKVSEINVQDPIVLNVNTTKHLNTADVEIFQDGCRSVSEVMGKVSSEYALGAMMSYYTSLVASGSTAKWNLSCPETILREDWHRKIYEASRFVFSEILFMDLGPLQHDERFKLEGKHGSRNSPLLEYTVKSKFDIFTPKHDKLLQNMLKETELQCKISTSSVMQERLLSRNSNFEFTAIVCVLSNFINRSVDIKLIKQGKSKSNGNFGRVISYLMGGNFKRYMAIALARCS